MPYPCTPDRLRVAIIGCCAVDQERMSYGGARWTVRELVGRRLQAFAHHRGWRIEPTVFWPVGRNYDFPDIDRYDAIIIPGSKLNIDKQGFYENPWMDGLIEFIKDAQGRSPMLGICFGHQAIAAANGAPVRKIPYPHNAEIGFASVYKTQYADFDPLFKDLPNDFEGLFSHFCYLPSAPRGSRILAYGDYPGMVQAYRMGESTWGVQFHPDYSPCNVAELVEERKPWLSKMVDISEIKIETQKRHDERVLVNFIDRAFSITTNSNEKSYSYF